MIHPNIVHIAMPHLLHDHFRKSVGIFSPFAHKLKFFTERLATLLTFELSPIQVEKHSSLADTQISHLMPMILVQLRARLPTARTDCTAAPRLHL
jgi:hypothetical protein